VPGFFEKMGFSICAHDELPHKVFNDCMHCPKFQACDEIAMERVLDESAPARLFGKPVRAIPMPVRKTPAEPKPQ
jgi:hypothetical protein